MSVKYTIDKIRDIFASQECEFLDELYNGKDYLHNFRCKCGNTSKIRLSHFMRGIRCGCNKINNRFTLEQVKEYFRKHNCEFLDEYFKNSKEKHNFKCSCGRLSKTRLHNFMKGHRCGCTSKKTYKKMTLAEVQEYYKSRNMKFLDEFYLGLTVDHNIVCSCGTQCYMKLVNMFKRKNICTHAGLEKLKPKTKLTLT